MVPRFNICYSKPNKRFIAKPIKEQKNYDYLHYIMRKIIKRASQKRKIGKRKRMKRQLSLTVAPQERPPREETIESKTKYKRLKL